MADRADVTIRKVSKEACTGCFACLNACPFQAVQMKADSEGFLFPEIQDKLCTKCGACARACPALHVRRENAEKPELYAARAEDSIRAVSSSGGVFTVLAREIFRRGGVVCGAAFDENMTVRHVIVENETGLEKLRGSKYVQSRADLIYREVERYLQKDVPLLFTGTPCQVAALYGYLQRDDENLYTADILCHGVPSDQTFHKYLAEILPDKTATDARFRDKRFGWTADYIVIQTREGVEYTGSVKQDPYQRAFLRNLILRRSCENCPFSDFPRQGMISIGDFWGISRTDMSQNDKKGTSIVYVNNEKGARFWEAVNHQMLCKRFDFETTQIQNRIKSYYPSHPNRNRVFKFMENNRLSFRDAVEKALSNHYDIGLVCAYYVLNFGGTLTSYALYRVLEDMGYSCLMIERPADSPNPSSVKNLRKIYLEVPYPANALSRQRKDKFEMAELNSFCDMFVTGSDQLFNDNLYREMGRYITLDWVDGDKKKIAYAASYGHGYVWGSPATHAEMSRFMRRFDAFSVREKSGVKISKDVFGVDAEWVLDPIFLCNPQYYFDLAAKSKQTFPEHVIGSYILDPSPDVADTLRTCENVMGCKARIFSEFVCPRGYLDPLGDLEIQSLKVEERLQLIRDCDLFVTDSFHGTCLAIILKKPFLSILNTKRGGSRFESILSLLGLSDRLIRGSSDLKDHKKILKPIDFEKAHAILNRERKRCLQWLKNALCAEPEIHLTDYDLLIRIIRQQQQQIHTLEDQIRRIYRTEGLDLDTIRDVHAYLQRLKENARQYAVLISVRDTPGIALNAQTAEELHAIGIQTDLREKHWKSFAAVIDGGKTEFEALSDDTIRTTAQIGADSVTLVSSNFVRENVSKIQINRLDYSVNKRGLNFVVIHKKSGQIIDSVCFDLHLRKYQCYRKKL